MARHKLSELKIRAETNPGLYGDGDGLWLRAQKGGSKSWVFIWRRGQVRREMGLGGYGNGTAPTSLALAREKAEEVRGILARDGDPLTEAAKAPEETAGVQIHERALTPCELVRRVSGAPTGRHVVTIIGCAMAKEAGDQILFVEFRSAAGREFVHDFPVSAADYNSQEEGQRVLSDICSAVGNPLIEGCDELHGKILVANITVGGKISYESIPTNDNVPADAADAV